MKEHVETFPFNPKETLTSNGLEGLWKLLKGYRLLYLAAAVSLFIAMSSKTATYLLLRFFIDNILKKHAPVYWYPIIGSGFLGLALIQGSFTFLSGKLSAKTSESITMRLRNYLFNHIQSLSFSYHDRMDTGELIQRTTGDVETIRRFYSEQAISLGRVLLLFCINFVAILMIDMKLAILSIAIIPIIVVVSLFFFKKISYQYNRFQDQEARLSTALQESLTGIRVVKAFARQDFEEKKFERENYRKFIEGRKLIALHGAFWPITDVLCGTQLLAGYVVGGLFTIEGIISIGSYLAYSGLLIWIIFPIRMLGRLIVETSKARVSYGRIFEIVKQQPEDLSSGKNPDPSKIEGKISFDSVSFRYADNSPVLDDVSFSVEAGEIVALLGPTGSGKTTLVNLLPRFYEYSGGSLKLDGIELREYSKEYLRKIIGFVEQEPFLFSQTIWENIAYGAGRKVTRSEIEEAAKSAHIHDSIVEFPKGYETIVGEKGVTLSGGQKQRIAIARAILKDPRILILDDSTSSVDSETEQKIWSALVKLMEGRTTFIIAHRIESLMKADKVCVLDKGRIIQMGSHHELIGEEGMYRKIYNLQSSLQSGGYLAS